VKDMFYHAFDGYMQHAFPLDELRPLSCQGEDSLGGYALTLVRINRLVTHVFFLAFVSSVEYHHSPICFFEQIDSLDTLALLGDKERFSAGVQWVGKNVRFDIVSKHQ
jgi:mannosidase alpha-like ER degradation enhancer 2